MEEKDKKIGHQVDRLVMGIILGGAIGSVLGLTLAPRKGKETRDLIKKKGEELMRDHREKIESAKYQFKKRKGFLKWALGLIGKKQNDQKMPKVRMEEEENPKS